MIRTIRLFSPGCVWTAYKVFPDITTELYDAIDGTPRTVATARITPLPGSMLTTFAGPIPSVDTPYSNPLDESTAKSSSVSVPIRVLSRTTRSTLLYVGLPGSMSIV